jgi:hypothetical protein
MSAPPPVFDAARGQLTVQRHAHQLHPIVHPHHGACEADKGGALLLPREAARVAQHWAAPLAPVRVVEEPRNPWIFRPAPVYDGGEMEESDEPPLQASWLLAGLETSTAAVESSRIAFMGIGAVNPHIYRAPKPIHAHDFHVGYAPTPDSARLPPLVAPRSCIWTPVLRGDHRPRTVEVAAQAAQPR